MKRLIVGVVAIIASVFCMPSNGNADVITWNYTYFFSGTSTVAGVPLVTLQDLGANTVKLTMDASDLTAGQFIGGKGFYFNSSIATAGLTFSYDSGQAAAGISKGSNSYKADGTGGYFDINISFADSGSGRLTSADPTSVYIITGAGLDVHDFEYLSTDINGNGGIYLSAVHLQGLNDCYGDDSVWLAPGENGHRVSEPGTLLLLGSGLLGLVVAGRKKFRK